MTQIWVNIGSGYGLLCLEITVLKLLPHLPGASELMNLMKGAEDLIIVSPCLTYCGLVIAHGNMELGQH